MKNEKKKQEKDKGSKKESITRKSVKRRSKRIKNVPKNFKIYCQNVRGLMSKLD